MDQSNIATVLQFQIKSSSNTIAIRSAPIKEYFLKLTSNVDVLYPTQLNQGLLLCKSKRTEEKISNMRHSLGNGTSIILSPLPHQIFYHTKSVIDVQTVKTQQQLSSFLQQCLPFLTATGGKLYQNPDGSIVLEGHIVVLNAINSYVFNKALSHSQSMPKPSNIVTESISLRSGNISTKVVVGNLIEQNVDSIMVPMNDKYNIHAAFDRQLQSYGGTALLHYLKELTAKGTRAKEGEIISFPNREVKIPVRTFFAFIVPRLPIVDGTRDISTIDAFQPTYEQFILRALQIVDQSGATSLAMPVLEPVKTSRNSAVTDMAIRAMVSAIRQLSQNPSIKLRLLVIVDHQTRIKSLSKRVEKYQKQFRRQLSAPVQLRDSCSNTNHIDLDAGDEQSFTTAFGVPKSSEVTTSTSDSEPEEYAAPYNDNAKV